MVGMLGIPQQFKQHALLVSLSQLQAQSASRAARFRRLNDSKEVLPQKHFDATPPLSIEHTPTHTSRTPHTAELAQDDQDKENRVIQNNVEELVEKEQTEKHVPLKSSTAKKPAAPSPTQVTEISYLDNEEEVEPARIHLDFANDESVPATSVHDTPQTIFAPPSRPSSPLPIQLSSDETCASPVAPNTPTHAHTSAASVTAATPHRDDSLLSTPSITPATPNPLPVASTPKRDDSLLSTPSVDPATPNRDNLPVTSATPNGDLLSTPSVAPATPNTSSTAIPNLTPSSSPEAGRPKSPGPINPVASRQLWELLAGTKGLPDCAALIAARADVECRNGDRGQTPLMQACFAGHNEVAAILIRSKADVNAKDLSSNQQTPLLYAVFAGKSHMVDLLIHNGANPNEKDLHGYTALMYAVHYGQPEVASYLIREAGCSIWDKDPHGRSAFKLALDKAPKDQGKILTCVCRALFDRGQGLPSDPEQLGLIRESLLLIAHEQCRQLRAVMKVHQDSHGLPVFVIDNGSCFIRAGLSTAAQPKVFPSVRGSLKGDVVRGFLTQNGATSFLGDEALQKKQLLQLNWPLRKEWDLKFLEDAWDKAFTMCQVDPSHCAVVLTQPRSFAQEGGQKVITAMQELLFQRFSVQFVSVVHSAAAASVGPFGLQYPVHLSLHVGFSVATAMVWQEGRTSFMQAKVGGMDCTDYLQKNSDWGLGETSAKVWEVVNLIKESKAYCLPYASAPPRDEKEAWTRPDGTQLNLGPELASAAEPLFDPNLVGKRSLSLPNLVKSAIQAAPAAVQVALWNNIILSGGCSLFAGFDERLLHELKQLDRSQCGGSCPVRIVNPPGKGRVESAWRGASSLFVSPAYFGCLVNQDEFEESGALLSKVRVDGCDSLGALASLETR